MLQPTITESGRPEKASGQGKGVGDGVRHRPKSSEAGVILKLKGAR